MLKKYYKTKNIVKLNSKCITQNKVRELEQLLQYFYTRIDTQFFIIVILSVFE